METRSSSRRPPSSLAQISKHKPEWESVTRKDPRGEAAFFWGEMNLLAGAQQPTGQKTERRVRADKITCTGQQRTLQLEGLGSTQENTLQSSHSASLGSRALRLPAGD